MVFMDLLQSVMKGTCTPLVVNSKDLKPQVDPSPNRICTTSITPFQALTDANPAHRTSFPLVSGEIEGLTQVAQTLSPPWLHR